MLVNDDVVCLDMFSELRYIVNKESQKMHALVVTAFKKVCYIRIKENNGNELLPCERVLTNEYKKDLEPSASQGAHQLLSRYNLVPVKYF